MQIGVEEIDRKYDVLSKLGEGGMGTVYKVRHRYLDEPRVIKTIQPQLEIDDDLQQRFLREAQVAAKLRHPNIATIHDFSVGEDGTAYIVMEYIEGKNVRQYQRSERPLGVDQVIEVGRQSLDALAYLHSKQFVHRDISTDNMMLSWPEGRLEVKLIDLGLAKSLQNERQWQTRTGMLVGKVRYISPEQLSAGMGGVEVDHRSDLYAFGVVMYELLTHEYPIVGDDEMSMIAGHLHRPPRSFDETDPTSRISPALRLAVLKALEKNPDQRYGSAIEFSRALTSCDSGFPATADLGVGRTTVLTDQDSPTEALPETVRAVPAQTVAVGAETATLVTELGEQQAPALEGAAVQAAPRRSWMRLALVAGLVVAGVVGWLGYRQVGTQLATEPNAVSGPPAAAAVASDEIFFGRNHALVIGNNNYQRMAPLETAVNDARAIADLLERRYGFEVRLLEDVDRAQIVSALHDFNSQLTARDNLLIYYAGHGQLQGNSEYWLAVDADPDRSTNWISTRWEISGTLKSSRARHILVVADSCYSGAAAGVEPPSVAGGDDEVQVRELVKRTSRLVLTSGGLQPVLDTGGARHSLFARILLETLRENNQTMGVSRLFPAIREQVSQGALERGGEQVPVLTPIPDSLDEGGEFFFVPSDSMAG